MDAAFGDDEVLSHTSRSWRHVASAVRLDGAIGVQAFHVNGKGTVKPAASAALLVLYGF